MNKKMVRSMEESVADKMRDKGHKEMGSESAEYKKKPKLGSGARFAALKKKLDAKGAKDPAALAAFIGRQKYGAKKFNSLSHKGR